MLIQGRTQYLWRVGIMTKYSLLRFLRNIKFLMRYSLEEREIENKFQTLLCAEDMCRYEVLDPDDEIAIPRILSPKKTLELLSEHPKSFARFGDGEVAIIRGESISFQEYEPRLADAMSEIISSDSNDLYVGINYSYFHTSRHMNLFNRRFYMLNVKPIRNFLLQNCNYNRTYIAAGFNQMYMTSENEDLEKYYSKIKRLFKDRDLVIFAGKGIFDSLDYDVFELATSKEYVWGPSRNAFSKYDDIYEKALTYGKDKTLCFVLGPTSKVLVYNLAKQGYMAWDIGHMAKDYDCFCRKQEKSKQHIIDFYSPD